MMVDTRIVLSGLWVATMLTYLLGDVLRIFSGDAEKMFAAQAQVTGAMWLGIAILMLIPIVMVVLSLILDHGVNRWVNIIVALFWIVFNLSSLNTYPSAYDKFLLIVSMGFNALTVWYAWKWV
jgi:hypothetical protein